MLAAELERLHLSAPAPFAVLVRCGATCLLQRDPPGLDVQHLRPEFAAAFAEEVRQTPALRRLAVRAGAAPCTGVAGAAGDFARALSGSRLRDLALTRHCFTAAETAALLQGAAGCPQLEALNLSGCQWAPGAWAALCAGLPALARLQALRLAQCGLAAAEAAALCPALALLPQLRAVDLRNNPLAGAEAPLLYAVYCSPQWSKFALPALSPRFAEDLRGVLLLRQQSQNLLAFACAARRGAQFPPALLAWLAQDFTSLGGN